VTGLRLALIFRKGGARRVFDDGLARATARWSAPEEVTMPTTATTATTARPRPGRILVVYFSRTGYTRRAAEGVARAAGGELCAIAEKRSRRGLWGYARCLWQASFGRSPTVEPLGCDPTSADCVVIGTPIWGWRLASPVRSFAQRYRGQLGHFAFFCTEGGSGSEAAFAELQRILGRPPVATLALTDAEIDGAGAASRIEPFVRAVTAAAASPGSASEPRSVPTAGACAPAQAELRS
jgi:flavodoxin